MNSYQDKTILYVSFNQDFSCFVAGTERGFKIYNTFPFNLKFERILDGGIAMIEMLYRSSIFALVGGGKNPKYTSNKVVLWDDYQTKVLNEFKFTSSVKNVKLKKDKIIIVLSQRIYVYNMTTYKQIELIETLDNPRGLVSVSSNENITVILYPHEKQGQIKSKCYEKSSEVIINAHEGAVSCIAVSPDGLLIATTSEKGTLIRIFFSEDGEFIEEFRRGQEKADINYICFDQESNYLAATSDRGTIHIWSLGNSWKILNEKKKANVEKLLPKNNSSFFRFLPNFMTGGFFNSDKSFAQFRIKEDKAICGFGPENNLFVISSTGKYYMVKFDPKDGGTCTAKDEQDLNSK